MGRPFKWAVFAGVSCLISSCSDGSVVRDDPLPTGGGTDSQGGGGSGKGGEGQGGANGGQSGVPTGAGVGEACSKRVPCRDGLACSAAQQKCEPSGDKAVGDACVIGAECKDGQCVGRQCAPAGEGAVGGGCRSDLDCAQGLRCAVAGLSLACAPEGAADLGADCASSVDCFGGLACLQDQCAVPPAGLPPLGQPWAGVECAPPVTEGVKAYFEVPGAAGADEGDFFRLPFPTDVRRRGNKLDLSGFPTPGKALLGVDPVQLYVDSISENDSGWGAYPTVLFRFSGPFEYSYTPDGAMEAVSAFPIEALRFVDVTDPAKGRAVGWSRWFTDARTNYICHNFMAVTPPMGRPLEPGHTYAVFILGETQTKDGPVVLRSRSTKDCNYLGTDGLKQCDAVTASANMAAVLKAAAPADAELKAAHAAFAPLRAYLAATNEPVANVLTASVFTVGQVQSSMTELAAAVAKEPTPTASKWVKCGGKAVSPCPQAEGERACGTAAADYDEYQALLSIPVFQEGTAPYRTPADGGGVSTKKPRREEVCMSLTVPTGTPPSAGWPTVVFAHGTGGNFRSHVREEVAGLLATARPPFAVIGIDQVQHGPRRGDSLESPDNLFFNFLNPAAARGNPLQGAADQLSLARFAKALSADAATTGGSAIKVDANKLFFFGHSQGSTEGSLMLPFADDFKAAVLSGNGASLRDALRTKTKPQNIAGALPIVLQDPVMLDPGIGEGVTLYHPVLSLLQQWIDPADPLNFARAIGTPLPMHKGKHLFQTFGLDDSYSPPVTLATFSIAAGLTQVTPDASAKKPYTEGLPQAVAVGYKAAPMGFTLGMRQYAAPKGSDGHFVVFDTQAAQDDLALFLTGAAGTTPPAIGQ